MRLVSAAKYAALQARYERTLRDLEAAEKRATDRQDTIRHLRDALAAGCRCPVCRKANSERLHRQRKRTSPPTTTTSDTPGNTTGGKQ